jgi:hypothetical protein
VGLVNAEGIEPRPREVAWDNPGMAARADLQTDYLVVGAGAVGMAFVDAVIEDPAVDVVMVDRRAAPGGHWLDAYPFVQLHQPSANYGVSSTPLGYDRVDEDGPNRGFYELAGAAEICGYFDGVMRHRLLPSGRVRFFPMSEHVGHARFRSLLNGSETQVTVRRRVVDATFLASRVPATDPPPFEIADGARCIPVGDLVRVDEPPAGFVIIGAGKTAMDACTWLLLQGTPPDAVTWIRPRDAWLLNRVHFQPRAGAIGTFEGVVHEVEALAASTSVEEAYDRLADAGVMLRLDPRVRPTMVRGATVSEAEAEGLRRIEDVVRLGHVQRIETDRIVLEDGTIPTTPDHVHVHCAAPGLPLDPPRPIFTDDGITLQSVIRMSPTLSAALTGFVETTDRSTAEKNRLLPPNPYSDTAFDFLRAMLVSLNTELGWREAPDVQAWLDQTRLNVLRELPQTADPERLRDLQGRFLTAVFPALAKLHELAAGVTPAERERLFDPA